MDLLKEISQECDICQRYGPRRIVFQVRDKKDIRFNHRIRMDLVFIPDKSGKQRPVLHIIDEGTNFQATSFLRASNTGTVWNGFLKIWACSYI